MKNYLIVLTFCFCCLTSVCLAQDTIVQTDGTVITPVRIEKITSFGNIRYTFGVNPKPRIINSDYVAYLIRGTKRADYNPLDRGVTDPLSKSVTAVVLSDPDEHPVLTPSAIPMAGSAYVTQQGDTGADYIYFHDGTAAECRVMSVGIAQITYQRIGEVTQYSIGRAAVQKIRFVSGREELISTKVIVRDVDDWELVALTEEKADIEGLNRLGEVKGKSTGGFIGVKGVDAAATRKLKRDAAQLGGHIVLLLQNQTSAASFGKQSQSFKSGVVYGYPVSKK